MLLPEFPQSCYHPTRDSKARRVNIQRAGRDNGDSALLAAQRYVFQVGEIRGILQLPWETCNVITA